MILDQIINRCVIGGKDRNHVRFPNDDLSVQDVIISVVAIVNDKGVVHNHSCGVAMAVGAGIGLVGWHPVVGSERVVKVVSIGSAEDDDASACAFYLRCDIFPATNGM